jgi:hypothetical protein
MFLAAPRISSTNSPTSSSVGPKPSSSVSHHGDEDVVGFAPTVAPSASSCWKIWSFANTGRSVLKSLDTFAFLPGG